jgi:hypothetical protein
VVLILVTRHNGAQSEIAPETFVDMTPTELLKQVPEFKHLEPAENQALLPLILVRVGANVADFFDNFSNTTCTERVSSAVKTPYQGQAVVRDAKFNYLALVRPGADKTGLQELRTDSKGKPARFRGTVVTIGFVGLAAHFHPAYQRDSRFRYLGRELLEGSSTYVVAFAQRPAMARQLGRVVFGDEVGFVLLQGVAWIDPVRFRILRLLTDIQQPELNVGLRRETTEIEYFEVTFKQGGKTLWLPRKVSVRGQLRQYTFHNHHSYSHYRLFLVQTGEKQKAPRSP